MFGLTLCLAQPLIYQAKGVINRKVELDAPPPSSP